MYRLFHTRPNSTIFGLVTLPYLLLFALLVAILYSNGHPLSYFTVGLGDAWEYHTLGEHLLNEHSFTLGERPEFFRTPGYPLLLAVLYFFFNSPAAVVLFQILIVGLSAVLIFAVGARLFSTGVGALAAALYALDPTAMITAFMTLSDIWFVFILLCCLYLITNRPQQGYTEALLLGALGGHLSLVRPLGEFILPILALWFLYQQYASQEPPALSRPVLQRAGISLVCIIGAAAAVLLPWMIRNYAHSGHFALSTAGPYNMLFYNVSEFEVYRGLGDRDTVRHDLETAVGTHDNALQRDFSSTDAIRRVTAERLEGEIPSYALFHSAKSIPFFIASSIQGASRALHMQGVLPGESAPVANISSLILHGRFSDAVAALTANPWSLLERFFWAGVLTLCAAGLLLVRGKGRAALVFFALIALAFALLTGPVSFPRYRLPAEPFLFLGASAGAAALYSALLRVRNRS